MRYALFMGVWLVIFAVAVLFFKGFLYSFGASIATFPNVLISCGFTAVIVVSSFGFLSNILNFQREFHRLPKDSEDVQVLSLQEENLTSGTARAEMEREC